jgi:hypothetical protein
MFQPAETIRRCPVLVTTLMLAATALTGACSKATAPGNTESAPGTEAPAAPAPGDTAGATPEAEPGATPGAEPGAKPGAKIDVQGDTRYHLTKDGTQIALGVTQGKDTITFQLATAPSDPRCRLTLSGTAKEKGGDSETREDEQGELVEVNEYIYESKDCGATISIQAGFDHAAAWVSTYDCTLVPEACWLTDLGPLRK